MQEIIITLQHDKHMSSITTIASGGLITNSRADINNNFAALNADKMETSVLDTDTTLAANSDSKIPSQKAIKAYVDSLSLLNIEVETTAGTTHSLTTDGTQKVIVFAKGDAIDSSTGYTDITLSYNGVQKDIVQAGSNGTTDTSRIPFALQYTETPTAGTRNITVAGGSCANVVIIVMKI